MKTCGVVLLTLCLALPAWADVYKWTDEAGRVHYGERPPGDGAQRMQLPTRPAGPADDGLSDAQRRARQQRVLEAYGYERERKKEAQARDAARDRQRAQACEELKQRWRRLNHPGPVYFSGEDGRRRYLDDSERAAEQDRMRPAYREACGGEP
jgi:hypothetical protein